MGNGKRSFPGTLHAIKPRKGLHVAHDPSKVFVGPAKRSDKICPKKEKLVNCLLGEYAELESEIPVAVENPTDGRRRPPKKQVKERAKD